MRVGSLVVVTSIVASSCSLLLDFDEQEAQETPIDAALQPAIDSSPPDATLPCVSLLSFESSIPGRQDVYTVTPDGSDVTTVIAGSGPRNFNTRWSPDGQKLLFHTDRDGNFEVYSMDSDGANPTNLTNNAAIDQAGFWSPDGSKILFVSDRDNNQEVYWMNADGTGATNVSLNAAIETFAQWSPDGTRIYFLSNRDALAELHSVALDGSDLINFTAMTGGGNISSYSFSPDGTKLAFDRPVGAMLSTLFTINIDGSALSQVTNSLNASKPRWLSNTRIVFQNIVEGNTEVFVVDANGDGVTNLSNNPAVDRAATMQIETGLIAFISDRATAGQQDIWVMNSDGSGLVNVTEAIGGQEAGPRWRPCQ